MQIDKILIVDDEAIMRNFLLETFKRKGMEVFCACNGREGLDLIKKHGFDLIITDMNMPEMTGLELLEKVKKLSPDTMIVVITAYGSIDNAVEAMRLGAFHYLLKPFTSEAIEAIIEKANERHALLTENSFLREQVSDNQKALHTDVIAESAAMKQILKEAARIADSNANVFIHGESGTGKEVIAHTIHYNSKRASKPFIKVNCAAVPDTLIESEFFGHEKGAFTGANAKKLGRFELANQGTLLLDEISEIPLSLQAKLLRVTQEQEFERVGGTKPIKVDVRLISTSNRDVQEMLRNNILREDLFYRLNVVPIYLPPLRERKEDIIPLAGHFLARHCKQNNREPKTLSQSARDLLTHYPWPGNVRELCNIIERAVVMDPEPVISCGHLYLDAKASPSPAEVQTKPVTLKDLEKKHIIETLANQNNNKTKAAQLLGITPRTLRNKLKEFANEQS